MTCAAGPGGRGTGWYDQLRRVHNGRVTELQCRLCRELGRGACLTRHHEEVLRALAGGQR